jgi:hypothetical protein
MRYRFLAVPVRSRRATLCVWRGFMKKHTLTLGLVMLLLVGCGKGSDEAAAPGPQAPGNSASASAKPEEQIVGTWRVDMVSSNLAGMTDSEKAEGESIRTQIKADGTFSSKSSKEEGTGTWKLAGHEVSFSGGNDVMPPKMTLSDDGSKLTFSMPEGGKTASIVMVKE